MLNAKFKIHYTGSNKTKTVVHSFSSLTHMKESISKASKKPGISRIDLIDYAYSWKKK